MTNLFVYGTLCHIPLLEIVLGRRPEMQVAVLDDHATYLARGHDFPVLQAQAGRQAKGRLLYDLTPEDIARLDYYEGPFGYGTRSVSVVADDGQHETALVYFPDPGLWHPGADWCLADWQSHWGAIVVATAQDVMAQYPEPIAADRRYSMLVRGASRLRAAQPSANKIRQQPSADRVAIQNRRHPYSSFFAVEEYDLSFQQFDGSQSATVTRAAFVSGDAVTVLPYDPLRDRVLVVEQFRTGPFARGDHQPWQLEAIAGRVDPDETPEAAGRREAKEEAGLTLSTLIPIANYYPSPGAKTEFLYSYLAITDLPDGSAIIGGEASEAEDIKGHLLSFETLMALVASGEIANAPLILSAFWLERERPKLRPL